MKKTTLFIIFLILPLFSFSQRVMSMSDKLKNYHIGETYTMLPTDDYNPKVASILSLAIPGLGQVYSKAFIRGIYFF